MKPEGIHLERHFLIVDGNSLMHRAFHALPLMDADGVYTNAIHGFLMMLLKAVEETGAAYLAVCFDEHGPTFRHEAYPEYKAGRAATPDELRQQFGTIRSLLDDMGIRRYGLQGWEADDLLGTLSLRGEAAGAAPLLLTGDRDALQLVSGGTELLFTRKGISETVRFTPGKVYEEYGFRPDQVTDWKGLAGDSSRQHPRHRGHRRQDRREAAAAVRHPGGRPGPRGRGEGQAGRKAARRRGHRPDVQGAGDDPPGRAGGLPPGGLRPARPAPRDPGPAEAEAEQHHPPAGRAPERAEEEGGRARLPAIDFEPADSAGKEIICLAEL